MAINDVASPESAQQVACQVRERGVQSVVLVGDVSQAGDVQRMIDGAVEAFIQTGKSYLYYETVRGNRYVFYPPFIPSQYIRRLLAEAIGIQNWNWRQCGREERLLSTLSRTSRLR